MSKLITAKNQNPRCVQVSEKSVLWCVKVEVKWGRKRCLIDRGKCNGSRLSEKELKRNLQHLFEGFRRAPSFNSLPTILNNSPSISEIDTHLVLKLLTLTRIIKLIRLPALFPQKAENLVDSSIRFPGHGPSRKESGTVWTT